MAEATAATPQAATAAPCRCAKPDLKGWTHTAAACWSDALERAWFTPRGARCEAAACGPMDRAGCPPSASPGSSRA